MIDKARWNNLQLQAEQRDNIGLTNNLARLEEAIDYLNELDFNDSNLNEDLETIIDSLISFWSMVDAKVAKKEQAAGQGRNARFMLTAWGAQHRSHSVLRRHKMFPNPDNWITGNWGEDSVPPEEDEMIELTLDELYDKICELIDLLEDQNFDIQEYQDRWNFICIYVNNDIRPEGMEAAVELANDMERLYQKLFGGTFYPVTVKK